MAVNQRIGLTSYFDGQIFIINLVQQEAFVHIKLRVAFDDLPLQLKLYHNDRLIHFRNQGHVFFIAFDMLQVFRQEPFAFLFAVHLVCKGGQLAQRDTIPLLQGVEIVVPRSDTDHIGNTGKRTCRGAHP